MTRRDVLGVGVGLAASTLIPLNLFAGGPRKSLKFAAITDLHHGLAPDALERLTAFIKEVQGRKDLAFVIQMGDFCYSDAASKPCLDLWNTLAGPKLHVLGNHDMDRC